MKKIVLIQFVVLLGGTVFAWYNFFIELNSWLSKGACKLGCAPGVNPFSTPCFYGAIFFTIAFALSCIILFKTRKDGR